MFDAQKSKEDFAAHFEMPADYTIPRGYIDTLSVGLYFCRKGIKKRNFSNIPETNMSRQVFAKVAPIFESFITSGLMTVCQITNDIVKIVDFGTGVRADIICVFGRVNQMGAPEALQKTTAVQCETSPGSSYFWNFSNMKWHLKRHLKNLPVNVETSLQGTKRATQISFFWHIDVYSQMSNWITIITTAFLK